MGNSYENGSIRCAKYAEALTCRQSQVSPKEERETSAPWDKTWRIFTLAFFSLLEEPYPRSTSFSLLEATLSRSKTFLHFEDFWSLKKLLPSQFDHSFFQARVSQVSSLFRLLRVTAQSRTSSRENWELLE